MKQRQQGTDYQVVPYPKYRRWMVAAFRSTHHKPVSHGLLEVDVTGARAFLRDYKARTGESLSFTAFLIACLARAVDENKGVQAYRLGGKRLVVFDDVDVLTDMEHEVEGRKYVVPHVIRAANRKTMRELHDEIRAAQRAGVGKRLRQFLPMRLPAAFFRPFIWGWTWLGRRRPRLWKSIVGTVEISSVGMFGSGAGWGISPPSATALMVTVGGIGEKQVVVDGHSATGEYLSLTISVDHEIVDGAPAARFAQRLKQLIESGYGLGDVAPGAEPEPAGAEGTSKKRVPAI